MKNIRHLCHRLFASFRVQDKVALKFISKEEIDRFTDALWNDPDIEGLSHAICNGVTLAVPKEAVEVIREKGFQFEEQPIISGADYRAQKHAAANK